MEVHGIFNHSLELSPFQYSLTKGIHFTPFCDLNQKEPPKPQDSHSVYLRPGTFLLHVKTLICEGRHFARVLHCTSSGGKS